jgi:sulfur relay protein TusD/DsrE
VKILLIVNESPWNGTLGVTALRLTQAMIEDGMRLVAVYFREDAVYQAVPGRATDQGTAALRESWLEMSARQEIPLLLCSSAAQRRLDSPPGDGFREAGLAEVMELMSACDRVVTL